MAFTINGEEVYPSSLTDDPHVLTVTIDGIPYHIRKSAILPSSNPNVAKRIRLRNPEGNLIDMSPELEAKIFEAIADAQNNKGALDAQGSLEYGNQNTAELLPYEPVDNTNIPAVIGRGIGKYSDEFKWRLGNDPGSIALQGKYTMPAIAASALLPLLGKAAATTSIASIPTTTWINTAATAGFAGHGLNHWLNEGINGWGDAAMTALELAPLGGLAKPVYGGVVQPGMRLFNSPLTGNWTTIGNRQYRLNPNSLGANGVPLESRSITTELNISPEELYKALQEQEGYYFMGHGTGRTNVDPEVIFKNGLRIKHGDIGNTTSPISESNLVTWPHANSKEVIILPARAENTMFDSAYGRIPSDWYDANTFQWIDNPGFEGRGFFAVQKPNASFVETVVNGVPGVYTKPSAILGSYNTDTHVLRLNPNSQYKFSFNAKTTPQITAENTASKTPKVNWDADNWFKTISGRSSYSSEEAAELASHVPEYRAIEQRLFDEGKLAVDSNGNIVVVGSKMSPQEYIMRQSEAFQKMNPEHHYTGVPDYYMQDFENNSTNVESWTDRLSPSNVKEYAFGNFSKRKDILDNIKYFENLKNQNSPIENIEEWLKIYRNQLKEFDANVALMERLNQGKVYDITYPNSYHNYKMDAAGAHWARIPSDIVADAGIPKKYLRPGTMATDDIVYAANDFGIDPVVVNIDNVMDTYNGTLLNETIIPKQIPKKSVLGNTGTFDIEGPNKWKLYRSLIPPFLGLGTLYGKQE